MKSILTLSILFLLATLTSCAERVSSGGTFDNPVYGQYNSPTINAKDFITALNQVDGDSSYRVTTPHDSEHNYIVIWDDKKNEYEAISMTYLRSIVYYDYYSNDKAVASEYRKIEESSNYDGSYGGDHTIDFEVVDRGYGYNYDTHEYEYGYKGRVTGTLYEDELETKDVSLMAREAQSDAFIKKAAKVSIAFQVNIETSLSMVTLGAKMEKMLSRGEMTEEDQKAIASDMQRLTGVTLSEMQAASESTDKKEEVLQKIAHNLGTSTQNLEEKLLPGIFGINL
jgi:hypothetical protein